MSDVTLFKNNLPDYLKEVQLDDVTKALSGGGSKRISLRGSKFRLVVNGDEVSTSKNDKMEIVIVNAAKDVARQFYAKSYNKDEITAPDCWSNDGIAADKSFDSDGSFARSNSCAPLVPLWLAASAARRLATDLEAPAPLKVESNFTKAAFEKAVQKAMADTDEIKKASAAVEAKYKKPQDDLAKLQAGMYDQTRKIVILK